MKLENAPEGRTISELLDDGQIDGFMAPRPPSAQALLNPNIGWLFDDPTAAAKDYYKRTGIFPIMHVVGIRKTLCEQHPWLPGAVFKAFSQAKDAALAALSDTSATKVTLPFVEEQLKAARESLGQDFWSYGVARNRATIETFCATTMHRDCRLADCRWKRFFIQRLTRLTRSEARSPLGPGGRKRVGMI